jgi:hypothetical protein
MSPSRKQPVSVSFFLRALSLSSHHVILPFRTHLLLTTLLSSRISLIVCINSCKSISFPCDSHTTDLPVKVLYLQPHFGLTLKFPVDSLLNSRPLFRTPLPSPPATVIMYCNVHCLVTVCASLHYHTDDTVHVVKLRQQFSALFCCQSPILSRTLQVLFRANAPHTRRVPHHTLTSKTIASTCSSDFLPILSLLPVSLISPSCI